MMELGWHEILKKTFRQGHRLIPILVEKDQEIMVDIEMVIENEMIEIMTGIETGPQNLRFPSPLHRAKN